MPDVQELPGRPRRRGPAPAGRSNIRDVARLAGVSVATVSRVVAGNGRVTDATRERVLAAVAKLEFVVNGHARALGGRGTPIVALVVHDISGPSFAALARGVEYLATESNHLFVMCTTHGNPEREAEVVGLLQQQRPAGVLWLGPLDDDPAQEQRIADYAQTLDRVGARLVVCAREPLQRAPQIDCVTYDNVGGARAMTEHLIALGHRDILFAGGRPGHLSSERRLQGYLEAMAAAGLPTPPALRPPGDFSAESGRRAVREALAAATPFTAVAAVVDSVALGVIHELTAGGLKVPGDVSVTGFDDVDVLPGIDLDLTSVNVPFDQVGRVAAELTLNAATAPATHITLPVSVHVRATTAAARPEAG